jgi:hypothetical protein
MYIIVKIFGIEMQFDGYIPRPVPFNVNQWFPTFSD